MNNESVSFKAYLRSASVTAEVARDDVSEAGASACEVRRFIVDRDVSTSFSYLQEKMVTLFPQLRRADFRLSWTDDDNDDVVICSDEELIIALTEMKGPVYKINVTIKEKKEGEKPNGFTSGNEQGNSKGEVHEGVTCDACDKGVVGFRYKCVVCPDYDLCGNCEAKGVHPGHNMIRISNPEVAWPHHFFRRLNKMHERVNRRCGGRSASCDVPSYGFDHEATHKAAHEAAHEAAKAFQAASNAFPNGPRMGPFGPWMGHGPWARGGGCHRGRGRGGQMWNSMMRGWMGEEQASQQQQQQQQEATDSAQEGQADNKTAPPRAPSFEEIFANGGEYLRTVGNLVAAALDPLGVNVEIDIEHNGERSNVASSRNQSENKEEEKKAEEERKEPFREEETKAAEEKPTQEAAVETITLSNEPKENSDDEWMVLRHDDANSIDQPRVISIPVHVESEEKEEPKGEPEKKNTGVPVAVPINISDQPARVLFGGLDGTLYPELPKQDEARAVVVEEKPSAPAAAAAAAVAVHPDPRIQVALQAMLNMGFTNDGGWLTQLLETKDGDIGKVLDVLQPVKPIRK